MKNENKLLDSSFEIVDKYKHSDKSYEELYGLFMNTTVSKRNNSKAIIKRDLALISFFSDVISALSFLAMIILVKYKQIDIMVLLFFALIILFLLSKLMLPTVTKLTYILSIIEDIKKT